VTQNINQPPTRGRYKYENYHSFALGSDRHERVCDSWGKSQLQDGPRRLSFSSLRRRKVLRMKKILSAMKDDFRGLCGALPIDLLVTDMDLIEVIKQIESKFREAGI